MDDKLSLLFYDVVIDKNKNIKNKASIAKISQEQYHKMKNEKYYNFA